MRAADASADLTLAVIAPALDLSLSDGAGMKPATVDVIPRMPGAHGDGDRGCSLGVIAELSVAVAAPAIEFSLGGGTGEVPTGLDVVPMEIVIFDECGNASGSVVSGT